MMAPVWGGRVKAFAMRSKSFILFSSCLPGSSALEGRRPCAGVFRTSRRIAGGVEAEGGSPEAIGVASAAAVGVETNVAVAGDDPLDRVPISEDVVVSRDAKL